MKALLAKYRASVPVVVWGTLLAFGLLWGSHQTTRAEAQTPSPTGDQFALEAPTEIRYIETLGGQFVTWMDNATGEEGYRIVVSFGLNGNTRSFEVGPNLRQLRLADDFRPGCPEPGPNVRISVTAFRGVSRGEPGVIEFPRECPPPTITPTAGPGLPDTGEGSVVQEDFDT